MKVVVKFPLLLLLDGGIDAIAPLVQALKGAIPVDDKGYGKDRTYEATRDSIEINIVPDSAINLPAAVALMGENNVR